MKNAYLVVLTKRYDTSTADLLIQLFVVFIVITLNLKPMPWWHKSDCELWSLRKVIMWYRKIPSIRCSIIIWCRISTVTKNQLLSNCVVQDLPSAVTKNQLLSNYAVQQLPSALTEYQVCNNFPELQIYQADVNSLQLDPSLTIFTQFTSRRFIYLRHFSTEFSNLYLVYIRALISLFQINTEESKHISLKQHFINTI